jgi:cytochrome c556
MRVILLAASFALLAACGGPETSQANNAQANIGNADQPEATAEDSNLQLRLSAGDAAKIMHERHEGMETIGKAAKAIARELQGGSPDLTVVRLSARQIAKLSRRASGWFPAGTGPEMGKTGAKPEIWKDPKDFSTKLAGFQKAAVTFNAAAAGKDIGAVKASFGQLGGACKACHDKYRAEMKH